MLLYIRALLSVLFLTLINFNTANADINKITPDLIEEQFKTLEQALNNKESYQDVAQALHNSISHDAQFQITVNNPVMPNSSQTAFTLNKEDYINSYLRGTQAIKGYEIAIQTLKVSVNGAKATSKEIMTERGAILDPDNPNANARPFVSTTVCQSEHTLSDGKTVIENSTCHTDVSFEESI